MPIMGRNDGLIAKVRINARNCWQKEGFLQCAQEKLEGSDCEQQNATADSVDFVETNSVQNSFHLV